MATDGCQTPAWTGAAFPYLPARHRAPPHAAPGAAAPASAPASTAPASRARTGTWDGAPPKLPSAAARAATAARPPQIAAPPTLRLPGGRTLPAASLATGAFTDAAALTAAIQGGATSIDVASGAPNAAVVAAALAALAPAARAALTVSVHLDGDSVVAGDPVAALAAALDAAGLADRGADVVLVGGPPPPRRAGNLWAAVAPALLASGRAASVGVADWGLADVEAALAAAAAAAPAAPVPRPALARVEAHPLLPQRKLVGVCRRKGVPVVAGGALGGAGGEVRGHPVVAAVARDVQKSPVEVLLRWAAERGTPVLASASSPAHASANAVAAAGWALPPSARAALDALETGARFHRPRADWPAAEEGGAPKPSLLVL